MCPPSPRRGARSRGQASSRSSWTAVPVQLAHGQLAHAQHFLRVSGWIPATMTTMCPSRRPSGRVRWTSPLWQAALYLVASKNFVSSVSYVWPQKNSKETTSHWRAPLPFDEMLAPTAPRDEGQPPADGAAYTEGPQEGAEAPEYPQQPPPMQGAADPVVVDVGAAGRDAGISNAGVGKDQVAAALAQQAKDAPQPVSMSMLPSNALHMLPTNPALFQQLQTLHMQPIAQNAPLMTVDSKMDVTAVAPSVPPATQTLEEGATGDVTAAVAMGGEGAEGSTGAVGLAAGGVAADPTGMLAQGDQHFVCNICRKSFKRVRGPSHLGGTQHHPPTCSRFPPARPPPSLWTWTSGRK